MRVCAGCTQFCTAKKHISKLVKEEVNRTVILKCSMVNVRD